MPVIMLGGSPPGSAADEIAGLQIWFDHSTGLYTDEAATTPATDGQNIRAFVDRKSSYKVTTQGVAANAPLLSTAGINGRPMLTWDAANDSLYTVDNTADNYLGTSNTEFYVMKYAASPSADAQYPLLFYDGNYVNGIRNNGGAATMGAVNWDGSSDVASMAATLSSWNIYTRMNNGSNVYIGVTDTRTASMTSTASGNSSFGANTNMYMRNFPGGPNLCYICEIIHYNVALTEADRQAIERRLAWKYGITLPY